MSFTKTTSPLKKSLRITALTFVILFALVTILGKGGGGDSTAPTVSAMTPADNSTGIAPDTTVTATFDEALDAGTIDSSSFILRNAQGSDIPAAVSLNMNTNTATLAPNIPLGKATRYTATLSTAIEDVAGNALAAPVSWSFTTVDGQWGTAAKIEADDAGDATEPQIALDGAGNGLAVWRQTDAMLNDDILSKRYTPVGGWDMDPTVLEDAPGYALDPRIAMNADSGDALAVWSRFVSPPGGDSFIHFNRYTAGVGWNNMAGSVSSTAMGTEAFGPAIAIDANGNALAAWGQFTPPVPPISVAADIWSSRYDAGTGLWGTPATIEDDADVARNPDIAFDLNGDALTVWQQGPNQNWGVWFNRFTAATVSWGMATLIQDDDPGDTGAPKIAVDAGGNAIAVWSQSIDDMGTRSDLWASFYTASSGTWGTPEKIETDDAGSVFQPQVAIDASGNAIAIWAQDDAPEADPDVRTSIWSNRFTAGTGWGSAELVETDDTGNAWSPQIAIDSDGNALAVWQQSGGNDLFDAVANRYTLGTGWASPQIIGAETGSEPNGFLEPQIAIDNNGNAIAVWQQFDGTVRNVWANRLQ